MRRSGQAEERRQKSVETSDPGGRDRAAGAATLVLDAAGRVRWANELCERFFGIAAEDLVGRPLAELLRERGDDLFEDPGPLLRALAETPSEPVLARIRPGRGREERWVERWSHPFEAGPEGGRIELFYDVTARRRTERELKQRADEAALSIAVSRVLARGGSLRDVLRSCTDAIVEHLDAAFARIWTLNEAEGMLELQASSGLYTHLDGAHSRIPVGAFKIGRIASERRPHLTNDVPTDPRVSDKAWARREGMVAFAGYPLIVEERLVGVMGMFSRRRLPDATLDALGAIADAIGLAIERARGAEALRASEQRYRTVFDQTYAFLAVLAPDGTLLDMNRAPLVASGHELEPMLGLPFWDTPFWRDLPEERDALRDDVARAARGESVFAETVFLTAEGERRLADRTLTPVLGEDGEVGLLIASGQDLTDRKRAEADRERYAGQLRGLAETALELHEATSLDALLEVVTLRAREVVGCHQSVTSLTVGEDFSQAITTVSLSGKYAAWRNYATPPDGSGIYRLVVERNASMRLTQEELEAHPAWRGFGAHAGEHPPMRGWLAAPLVGRDGGNIGLIQLSDKFEGDFDENDERLLIQFAQLAAGAIEVTRLTEELESRVRERTVQLEAANRELEAFAYSVSHDLRAPLRGIGGFSRVLEEEFGEALDDAARDYLARIQAAAHRMGDLIDDLLELSRLTRSRMERRSVDLSALARDVAGALRETEPGRWVELSVQDGLRAHGDPGLLRVALENLLGNAWKFTRGREDARIEVGVRTEDGGRAFFVRDNGAGFDMRYRDKLFAPFQRLHSEEEFRGSGIGLANVQRIVHRHGGRVWAEGEVGAGATFLFTLGD